MFPRAFPGFKGVLYWCQGPFPSCHEAFPGWPVVVGVTECLLGARGSLLGASENFLVARESLISTDMLTFICFTPPSFH